MMMRSAILAWLLCGLITTAVFAQDRNTPAQALLGERGGVNAYPQLYRRALNVFINAENAYQKGDYAAAGDLLNKLWADVPPASPPWLEIDGQAQQVVKTSGLNIGSPPCYYALRMLTDCVAWRLDGGQPADVKPVVWTVILVGHLESHQPRNRAERNNGKGPTKTLDLDPRIIENNHQVIRQSTRLFIEYVLAITKGQTKVELRFLPLNDLTLPGVINPEPGTVAGIDGPGFGQIWDAVPEDVKATTDWWWILYPSNLPEQHRDFKTTEFVTGGMGGGPRGKDPCFIIDDRWLVRKPPHLGHGDMHPLERRTYLPQWLQHEFFHHLYGRYPEYKLEGNKGHEWFDRKTWPRDFVGEMEPDYYYESLHKRLMRANTPLHVVLRNTPRDLSQVVTVDMLAGKYQHQPKENDWHVGELLLENGGTQFEWKNAAGVKWKLTPDLAHGCLKCAPGSPYYDEGSRSFEIEVKEPKNGGAATVSGFHFGGGFYKRLPSR